MAQPMYLNGTYYVPSLNGSLLPLENCTNQVCSLAYATIDYAPSLAGNLAYLVIFALLLVPQAFLGIRYRTWGFLFPMTCGLLLEIVGYIGRILLHGDTFIFNYFVIYLVCLTIAPAFICACIYLCLSRLIAIHGPESARFPPRVYTIVFICFDLISLILQATGGGLAATAGDAADAEQTGVDVMIAGLSFQVVSLFIFIVGGIDYAFSVRKSKAKAGSDSPSPHLRSKMFRVFPIGLAIATIFILIRCCYRVAELKDGFGGSLANNQVLFMIFEGPMIMIAVIALTIFHPGLCMISHTLYQSSPGLTCEKDGE